MKTPRKNDGPNPAEASKAAIISGALGLSAPLIAVLCSQALASPTPPANNISVGGPMFDPPGLLAAGSAIASIGAYRLMKLRAQKRKDEKTTTSE